MAPIEAAILAGLFLWLLSHYKEKSYEAALNCRESMIEAVQAIMEDDDMSDRAKGVAMGMFHASLIPGFLIKAMIRSTIQWNVAPFKLTSVERKKLRYLMSEHFLPVNVWVGMHWYVLATILAWGVFVIASLFRWIYPCKMPRRFEDELSQEFLGRHAHHP